MKISHLHEAMPSKRTPTWSRYCTVISCDPYVIVKMPDESMPWRTLVGHIFRFMKENYGILAKEISQIEGLAGMRIPKFRSKDDAENWHHWNKKHLENDAATLPRVEAAFAGDKERFKEFDLWAWNGSGFTLVRVGTDTQAKNPGINLP